MSNLKKNIKHFCFLTGFAASCIHGINKFIETTSQEKKLLLQQNGHFFQWQYGDIFYTKQGKGTPLLLIHHLHPAGSAFEWNGLVKKLAQNHTVYTLDLLGCGRSDKPNLTYTNYMYVRLITDFIKNIIEEKTDVVASGESCSFTLMAASIDDAFFGKLFLISPPSLNNSNPNLQGNVLKKLLAFPILGTLCYNVSLQKTSVKKLLEEVYFKKKSSILERQVNVYYESAHMNHNKGRFLYGSILGNYTGANISYALKKIKLPIYLIHSKDMQKFTQIAHSYIKQNETIEVISLSNCNKFPQLEEPDKLYKILQMFEKA